MSDVVPETAAGGAPFDFNGPGSARQFQDGRGDIDVEHHLLRRAGGRNHGGKPRDDWNPCGLFVRKPALVAQAVLAVEVAVVARENDESVGELSLFFERLDDLSDAIVHRREGSLAAEHGGVVRHGSRSQRRKAADLPQQGRLVYRRLAEIGPVRHFRVREQAAMPLRWDEHLAIDRLEAAVIELADVRVHGLVRQVEQERLRPGAPNERERAIVEDVGHVSGAVALRSPSVDFRIEYWPCPLKLTHMSKPGLAESSFPMCHLPTNAVS